MYKCLMYKCLMYKFLINKIVKYFYFLIYNIMDSQQPQIHKIAKIADDFYVLLKGYASDP